MADRPGPGRADQPQLVAAGGGQRAQARAVNTSASREWDMTMVAVPPPGDLAGHHDGVLRGQHRGDLLAAGLGLVELLPHAAVRHAEHDGDGEHGRGGRRARAPAASRPGQASERSHLAARAGWRRAPGRLSASPAGGCCLVAAAAAMTRSFRPAGIGSAAAAASRAVASRRLATSCAHSAHPARCRSNRVPVGPGDRVHRVGPGQGVRVPAPALVSLLLHWPTPRQSRSRISASRILVFTVPVGTPSRLATWP